VGSRYSQPRGVGLRNFEDDILRMKQKYERDAVGPAKQNVLQRAEENEVQPLAGKPYWSWRLSTVDLIVPTSLDQ
jgi:hypothetical protein